jgi:hypothetical protein
MGNPSPPGGKAGVPVRWPFHRGSVTEAPPPILMTILSGLRLQTSAIHVIWEMIEVRPPIPAGGMAGVTGGLRLIG